MATRVRRSAQTQPRDLTALGLPAELPALRNPADRARPDQELAVVRKLYSAQRLTPTRSLRGRQRERAALSQLLFDVRSGRSRVLVLRGEPGIGKTALLDDLCARADDVVVVRGAGVESEIELAFAGLHHMCSQMIQEKLDLLPLPQREAIRIAFGENAGGTPNPFLLGLAVLNRLADVAEEQPVLCLVDDAQWLDRATAQTLAFVARRLDAEAVGIVFAVREPVAQFDGLPELVVSGLAPEDARDLLGTALTGPVDQAVRERFIAETHGNPLALLELSRGLTAAELEDAFDRRDSRGLWRRLEESFQRRVEGLSMDARMLLLIAAAEPVGDPVLLWRAADLLGVAADAAGALDESGLLRVGAKVEFRHPLVRSAVYRLAGVAARRSVHGALAEVTDAELDPDRQAWHHGLAASGPDERVAVDLERSADRAKARGGYAAEAAFLERALTLTADFGRRGARALAAARARLAAGEPRTARDLLSVAEIGPLDKLGSVQLEVLRARIAFALGRGGDAPALLLKAAKSLEPLDPIGARDTYLDAISAVWFAGPFARDTHLRDVAMAARGVAWPDTPCTPDLLLRAFATLVLDGYAAGTPLSRQTVAALRHGEFSGRDLGWLVLGTALAVTRWDEDAWDELARRDLRLARETGALDVLPIVLTNRACAHVLAGELAPAVSLAEEIEVVCEATGIPVPPYAAVATAVFGPPDDAFTLIDATVQAAMDRGEGRAVVFIQFQKAILCNALGRYEEAWTAAAAAYENPSFYSTEILSELIESAARSGYPERAAGALECLREVASAAGTDWVLGVETRCRALLGDGETAEGLYRASIGHLQRTGRPVELARSHLAYGEWLRREGRRIDARQQLRLARQMFDAIGAAAFTDRAARELAATGETVRKRPGDGGPGGDLTAREAQIARLAADGLSNREIGEQLFISHRTVGYHLGRVFAKLDVANRAQLHNALDGTRSS
jgi:DNA-binding CsgD family transcriptional regulator